VVDPGTGQVRLQSSLLVPVRQADSHIGRWRYALDPLARGGVPAHVTLIVPWLDPDRLDAEVFAELERTLADVKAFDFDLTHVAWFGRRVLWAAPEPEQPFLDLIGRLAEHYSTPPWGGEFEEVIPHLTVGHAGDHGQLVAVAAEVTVRLPVHCRASEVWVMVGGGDSWQVLHKVALVG